MQVSILARVDNKLQQIGGVTEELRHRRVKKKMSMFFKLIKNDKRYAKNITSKGRYIPVLITLTFARNDDWNPREISSLIDKYRKHFTCGGRKAIMPRKDFRYVWVAELQQRGAVHYHICMWLPRFFRLSDIKPDSLGWWNYGYSNAVSVRRSVYAYLSKYMSKGSVSRIREDGRVEWLSYPKGCRIYGAGGLSKIERVKIAYFVLPKWVKAIFSDCSELVRRVKGGYEQGKTFLMSPYVIEEGRDWRDIRYQKAFSVIKDKETEIEWDEKIRTCHDDVRYYTPLSVILPGDSGWCDYLLRVG
jgi:hypothetical protein